MQDKDRLNLYLDRKLKERVLKIANSEKRSMNRQVELFIELAIDNFSPRMPKKEELQPAA